MNISIVIPCYNQFLKIGQCLASLQNINLCKSKYEVIFVDDFSTDGTYELLQAECKKQTNWKLHRLAENSGTPSQPRNLGIKLAKGEYIYFLDSDDEILPDAINQLWQYAKETNACIIRSPLIKVSNNEEQLANVIANWSSKLSNKEKVKKIISATSTVPTSFIKRSLLNEHQILWPKNIKVGEDTLFLIEALLKAKEIHYLAEPTYKYNTQSHFTPTATQSYGKKELLNHLEVWQTSKKLLLSLGIDYYNSRLKAGLSTALNGLIFKNTSKLDKDTFNQFSQFIEVNQAVISSFNYNNRLIELIDVIKEKNYEEFLHLCKPKLLIAGHDFKFIEEAIPELSNYYQIKLDLWQGHNKHDESKSRKKLEWADYIWCEWLVGNSQWYSKNKLKHQKLVVRMHRMELGKDFIKNSCIENIDQFISVSPLFFERLLERFHQIPRNKVRYIPNFVKYQEYKQINPESSNYTLGMVGILPARKGLLRALKILNALKKTNSNYKLEIFGSLPEDLAWVVQNPNEVDYFKTCKDYIENHQLTASVNFNGFSDIKQALAEKNIGYLLSVSDPTYNYPGPESFHLAIGDAIASGSRPLILHWPGCEYIWPQQVIHQNEQEIIDTILKFNTESKEYKETVSVAKKHLAENYSLENFTQAVTNLFL